MPTEPLEEPVLLGPSDSPGGLLFWLHGLGADGHDFAPIVPLLERPDLQVVLPHAPVRRVTLNGGHPMRAWYDIRHLAPGPDREPEADVRQSAALLSAQLRHVRARSGVPWSRVVVVGFSQGGAMALHLGLRWEQRLAGLVALSTYLVVPDTLPQERSAASQGLPLFLAHGTQDPTVHIDRGQETRRVLADSVDLTWKTYPMGHEVNMREIVDLRAWLGRVLPAT